MSETKPSKTSKKRALRFEFDPKRGGHVVGDYAVVPIDRLRPNVWNPNRMSPFMRDKLAATMKSLGFTAPILVRSGNEDGAYKDGALEIVDGEQRWSVAKDLEMPEVRIIDLGRISDAEAKTLTLNLNDIRGKHDRDKVAAIIGQLDKLDGGSQLLDLLPYDESELEGLKNLDASTLASLEEMPQENDDDDDGGGASGEDDEEDGLSEVLELSGIRPRKAADLATKLESLKDYFVNNPPSGIDMAKPSGFLDALIFTVEKHYDLTAVETSDEDEPKSKAKGGKRVKRIEEDDDEDDEE